MQMNHNYIRLKQRYSLIIKVVFCEYASKMFEVRKDVGILFENYI